MTKPLWRLDRSGQFLLLLTAVGLALRFYRIGEPSIWVDEAATIKYAAYGWDRFFWNVHGALHAVTLHYWCALFGTSETAMRSLSALAGAASIPALYWALRPLRKPRTTWIACALLAFHPFHIWYSQEVRNYVFLMLFVILSTGVMTRMIENSGRRIWSYGVANTAGFLCNLAHLFTLMSHGWTQLLRGRAGLRQWRPLIISWVVSLVLLTPWIYVFWLTNVGRTDAQQATNMGRAELVRGETTAPVWGIPYTYYVYSTGYSFGPSLRELKGLSQKMDLGVVREHIPWIALAAVAFGISAIRGAWGLWRGGEAARAWLWLSIVPVFVTYGVALLNLKAFNPRYASAAFPAYVLLVAQGVAMGGRRSGVLLGTAVAAPLVLSLIQHYHDPRYAKDDARGATAFLKEHADDGDFIFVVGTDEPLQHFYWKGFRGGIDGIDVEYQFRWAHLSEDERHAKFVESWSAADETFVLYLRDHWLDPTGEWRQYLRDEFDLIDERQLVGAEVWQLAAPAAEAAVGERP